MRPLDAVTWAVVLSATVVLAGCGTQTRTHAGSTPAPQRASSADFPLTLTREGGIAGFSDRVSISSQGRAVPAGGPAGTSCTLPESVLRDLSALARPVSGTATTAPAHPDDLVVVLETPHGSTRLTDAQLSGPAAVVTRLLEDLAKKPAQRTLCR